MQRKKNRYILLSGVLGIMTVCAVGCSDTVESDFERELGKIDFNALTAWSVTISERFEGMKSAVDGSALIVPQSVVSLCYNVVQQDGNNYDVYRYSKKTCSAVPDGENDMHPKS